ncbi:NapC/NirT family cytochrome c [Rhabdochromatium marinum]|uniref:NapC/NirT family cytochrome c n=1 Tax=Rhabdochromatium marinum TaxID=48729 RepID=UPI001903ADBB|nr:NapC/NirT family cytochrome c [Rhabdochromatium marinum]MBK1647426.1 butanol dehydrogenase [Rhabdochromatium marinum]
MPDTKASSRRYMLVFVALFVAGIGFAGLFNFTLSATNEMEFCVSCHTMQTNYLEYQESMHFKNQSGVQATCADCHVPKPFLPKIATKIIAAKDVYHEIMGTIDTPEKFEARRWHMASNVWKKMERTDSRECRRCHDYQNMDLSEQGRSARSRHSRAEDKGQTCIDCHKAVVHKMPREPEEPEEE